MNAEVLFGKFKISDCLKKDPGFAVYIADHVFLEKQIILKVLNTQIIEDSVTLNRFKREAQLLAKIEHPNIISVYDFGLHNHSFSSLLNILKVATCAKLLRKTPGRTIKRYLSYVKLFRVWSKHISIILFIVILNLKIF